MKIGRIPRFFPLEEIPWDRGEWLGLIFSRGNPLKRPANLICDSSWPILGRPNLKQCRLSRSWETSPMKHLELCCLVFVNTIGSNPKHEIVLTRCFCCICSNAHYSMVGTSIYGRYLHFRILKFTLNYFLIPKPKKHAHVLMFCPSTSQLPAVQRDL